ncbi:MAG TPA: hypothetical protein VFP40_18105 [Terriglobales bacterium]|nr:hypothetical protein [Terriglobales bacterium]
MKSGGLLAISLTIATVVLIVIGCVWPVEAARPFIIQKPLVTSSSTPEEAVQVLGQEIQAHDWAKAYESFANKAQFTEPEFELDLTGYTTNLRTYSTLDHFSVWPLHASADEADVRLELDWATVVGTAVINRDLKVAKTGNHWNVVWPFTKQPVVPPQVIPVNYLRWDVIYRGAGDDWGAQDVNAPAVRIVDMHPVQRADGVVVMGELMNEDVVPAYVSMSATLQAKDKSPIATEEAFDKISHVLLPKQVTPFLIEFPEAKLSQVDSINMKPFSTLVPASADPVIEIDNEKFNPAPNASLTGQLINQSGEVVNVAHVLGTLYDQTGQLVWVVDQYVDTALLPQTPVAYNIQVPDDIARKVSSQRTVVSTFSFGGRL